MVSVCFQVLLTLVNIFSNFAKKYKILFQFLEQDGKKGTDIFFHTGVRPYITTEPPAQYQNRQTQHKHESLAPQKEVPIN